MKKLKTLCTLILFVLFAKSTIAQYSPYVGYVPTITADRRVDWRNAGENEKNKNHCIYKMRVKNVTKASA